MERLAQQERLEILVQLDQLVLKAQMQPHCLGF
jgi:hypothetical protein